jgi:ABC-type bacteriocin/lantibiotic exporter with double-glycine peptidase domain
MIIDMPRGQQSYTYDCGTKVIHLMLAHYGIEVPYYKLLHHADKHKCYGIPENKMANIFRGYKLSVKYQSNCFLNDVLKYVEDGIPVIVLMQAWAGKSLSNDEWCKTDNYGHYSIMCGCDNNNVFFNDTLAFGTVYLDKDEFVDRWHCGDNKNFAMFIKKRKYYAIFKSFKMT